MLISTGGTVIRMPVEDVKRLGRSTQGVIVMRLREGETVSALAPVVEPEEQRNGDDTDVELSASADPDDGALAAGEDNDPELDEPGPDDA